MGVKLLLTGDFAVFPSSWPSLILDAEMQVALTGTGKASVDGKKVVVEADLASVQMTVAYKTPLLSTPGTGILMIERILPPVASKLVKTGGAPVLLQQAKFIAKFQVLGKAMFPGPPVLQDPLAEHKGLGEFRSNNAKATARQ